MKKPITIIAILMLLCVATGLALSEDKGKAGSSTFQGTVTAVNQDENSLTVEHQSGEQGQKQSMTFHWNEHTKIMLKGQEVEPSALSEGSKLVVHYRIENEVTWAIEIKLAAAPAE